MDNNAKHWMSKENIAILVSIAAAVFTGLQWYEARDLRLLTTRPYVVFEWDSDKTQRPLGVAIKTVGPAIAQLRSIEYYVNRKKVKDLNAALVSAGLNPDHNYGVQLDEDEPIAGGEAQWLIDYRTKDKKELQDAEDLLDQALAVKVNYCSVSGQCRPVCSARGQCGDE